VRPRRPDQAWRDRGSAIVEFVLVAPLLVAVAVAVLEFALVLHVRATLTAAAADGARAASLAGADPASGVRRARLLLADNLAGSVVRTVTAGRVVLEGRAVMVVRIEAGLPFAGLLGPAVLAVEGHSLREGWS
jgi:Flp pilus assembly protein TadG